VIPVAKRTFGFGVHEITSIDQLPLNSIFAHDIVLFGFVQTIFDPDNCSVVRRHVNHFVSLTEK
jgi:hypothetical protein